MRAVADLALIDDIVCDVLLSEELSLESDVSEWPTESGATISDHVRNKPLVVNMEILVSNHPIGPVASIRRPDVIAPADEVYVRLMQIHEARKPITIRTSRDTYEDMVLKSLTIPRDISTADALKCTAVFQQIQTVKNLRTERVAIPQAKRPKVINKPPVPVAKSSTVNFTDSLPLVKVYRRDGEWLWYDENISGWRYNAIHDAPAEGRSNPSNPYRPAQEGWVCYRAKPYGLTSNEWYDKRKTDAQYRDDIANAYEISKEGGGPLNKHDPFIDFGTSGVGQNGLDIRIVHAIIKK